MRIPESTSCKHTKEHAPQATKIEKQQHSEKNPRVPQANLKEKATKLDRKNLQGIQGKCLAKAIKYNRIREGTLTKMYEKSPNPTKSFRAH